MGNGTVLKSKGQWYKAGWSHACLCTNQDRLVLLQMPASQLKLTHTKKKKKKYRLVNRKDQKGRNELALGAAGPRSETAGGVSPLSPSLHPPVPWASISLWLTQKNCLSKAEKVPGRTEPLPLALYQKGNLPFCFHSKEETKTRKGLDMPTLLGRMGWGTITGSLSRAKYYSGWEMSLKRKGNVALTDKTK